MAARPACADDRLHHPPPAVRDPDPDRGEPAHLRAVLRRQHARRHGAHAAGREARDAGGDREVEGRARLRQAAALECQRGRRWTRRRNTIFFEKSVRLFVFDFGYAEDKRDIASEIRERMWPSLALAVPVFLVGLAVCITFALLMAFFRATYLDFWGVVLCVAMMSISTLFYIIGGQYLVSKTVAPGADLRLRRRLRRGAFPGPAGGDRGRQRHRLEQPLVPHPVPGGDGQGLRAHRARQGPVRKRRCCSATC